MVPLDLVVNNLLAVRKFFITFGDVIILTQWLLDEELTVNASTDDRCELVRTLDDGDVIEDIKHERPCTYDTWHSLLHPVLPSWQ